jgi:hypothetical protein
VVCILDAIYSAFDELCAKNGVQKMETVGKTYMACAGLHGTRVDHAHAVAELAEEILALCKRCVDPTGTALEVRMGIHTGKVLSGVVGLKRPQFSLFGDTVNTSSRIQSTGEAGRIHLSSETYAVLRKDYRCVKRQVQAKGKGTLTTYFLGERITRIPVNRKITYKEDRDDITPEEVRATSHVLSFARWCESHLVLLCSAGAKVGESRRPVSAARQRSIRPAGRSSSSEHTPDFVALL